MSSQVLIVDSDEKLAASMRIALEEQGEQVNVLYNAKDAVEYLESDANVHNLKLIVLSGTINAGRDGTAHSSNAMEVLHDFRKKYGNQVPVFMISILAKDEDVLEGLQSGADQYLIKPFSIAIFLERANKFLKKN